MKVAVCVPWRPGPGRHSIHDRCIQFWTDHGFPVIEADSDPDQLFRCNQARNNAVRHAEADVVIIADADIIPGRVEQVWAAVHYAADTGLLVWPHTVERHVPCELAAAPLEVLKTTEFKEWYPMQRGCSLIVISCDAYWGIGGFDEQFTPGVFGWDDMSFTFAAETLLGTARVEGDAFTFDTAGAAQSLDKALNMPRLRGYIAAWLNRDAMRHLVDHREPLPGMEDTPIEWPIGELETTILTVSTELTTVVTRATRGVRARSSPMRASPGPHREVDQP